ncbi:DUF551 domain-containing protein [Escherichia coli]|nr:DUF551 domain-containing protein [Escherichia coli]
MTTFTDKELIKEIKERISSLDVRDNIERRAYEIALASLEAEKVTLYRERNPYNGMTTGWQELTEQEYEFVKDNASENAEFRTVYTAPPAPVIQADVAQTIEILKQKLVECNRYNYCADAVKGVEDACHAAMLQGSQPVSQTYKFPVNTPCQDAPAHIWLQTAGVWPEDGELSELTWCSHNQHHDDTLYVRADLVNGNYPVTPDGWISCSERMPKETGDIIVVSDGIVMSGISYSRRDGFYIAALEYDDDEPIGGVTHWMPLPEPPQEVK